MMNIMEMIAKLAV